jgi:glutamate N-acetyltransferase/amino-acid N-acetyltransferase
VVGVGQGAIGAPSAAHPAPAFALAPGFLAGASACGLKSGGALDVALVVAHRPATAAGVFTTNRFAAAPVLYDREILARESSEVRAVVANAGCANACTGPEGLADARQMAALAAQAIACPPESVLVLSTGVIGVPLDMEKVERGIRTAADRLGEDAADAARAVMTTDTRPKVAASEAVLAGGPVVLRGFAKGAGMIHPDMATMLAILTTDATVSRERLDRALRSAVAASFNRISVDGDMSTNDTVLALASGDSGIEVGAEDEPAFSAALTAACASLARQIARDGEGATCLIEIAVNGAADEAQAHAVADSIARSCLVKTAIHGGDPNWGRILAAAGYAGVALDPNRIELRFGPPERELRVIANGRRSNCDAREAAALLRLDPVHITLDLGLGEARSTVWTCDLSAEYVAINAHYTT